MESDPVISVLSTVDRAVAPHGAFAEGLLQLCLDELAAPIAGRLRARPFRVGLVVAIALIGVSAATATYLAVRGHGAAPTPGRSELTVITSVGGGKRVAAIAAVGPGGRLRTLWRCPERGVFCGELTSITWSPDGKRLAFTLDEIGGMSGYVGLHIVNVMTGVDVQLPSVSGAHISRQQLPAFFSRFRKVALRQLGCPWPSEVAWAPDGKRLAYVCGVGTAARATIFILRADGTGRTAVPTGTSQAYWPSWSPDGKQIAFATQASPIVRYDHKVVARSSVYVVALDGSGRTLVARGGSAPAWSPDGRTIAYWSTCLGVRLVTPDGVDVTPGMTAAQTCPVVGPHLGPAVPAWSPDGSALAIATPKGVYVTAPDGTGTRRATALSSLGILGGGRPAWTPGSGSGRRLLVKPGGGL